MNERKDCLLKSAVMKGAKSAVEKFSRFATQNISPGQEKSMTSSPNGIVVFDNDSTTIEVTVKTKGKKASPSMKSSSPLIVKKIEGKRNSEGSVNSHHNNWSKIFREQNQSTLRQTMQQLVEKTPVSKSSPSLFENREIRRSVESRKSSSKQYSINERSKKEIPSRQTSSQRKSRDHGKFPHNVNPPVMTPFNSPESILVMDKGIQCGGIFDKSNDSFGQLNPVRTLGFLMTEMENLISDETASRILTQMEQVLMRIPIEQGNQPDLVTIASKAKLEATTAKLAATSKTIGESYKTVLKENVILQHNIEELSLRLKQSKERQSEMEYEMKQMRIELNDFIKSDSENKIIINDLREKTKQIDELKKIIADKNIVEKELIEVRELLKEKELEVQYLQIEKTKLSIMLSYNNSQFVELRNSIKNLMNNVTDQLANSKNIPNDDEFNPNPNYHSTVIEEKVEYPSPTRTSSNNSISPSSWRGVSDLSPSSGNISDNNPERLRRQSGSRQQSSCTSVVPNDSNEEKFDEKTHLEFTSVVGDQSVYALNSGIENNMDDSKFTDLQSADEVDNTRQQTSSSDTGVNNKMESNSRSYVRRKNSQTRSQLNKFNDNRDLRSPDDKTLIASEHISSANSMYQQMKGQLHEIFENTKMKGRMPINVPDPPRNFPNPDWTDSSLPTMSVTESNILL